MFLDTNIYTKEQLDMISTFDIVVGLGITMIVLTMVVILIQRNKK